MFENCWFSVACFASPTPLHPWLQRPSKSLSAVTTVASLPVCITLMTTSGLFEEWLSCLSHVRKSALFPIYSVNVGTFERLILIMMHDFFLDFSTEYIYSNPQPKLLMKTPVGSPHLSIWKRTRHPVQLPTNDIVSNTAPYPLWNRKIVVPGCSFNLV